MIHISIHKAKKGRSYAEWVNLYDPSFPIKKQITVKLANKLINEAEKVGYYETEKFKVITYKKHQ